MRKEETLRGRGVFSLMAAQGTKLDGDLLRCFFRVEDKAGPLLRAGFSVSSRSFNAVKRNRIRRLMRVAFDAEKPAFRAAAGERALSVLFVFKGKKGFAVGRLALEKVRADMSMLCRLCAAKTRPAPP